jgi:hypothetical protein
MPRKAQPSREARSGQADTELGQVMDETDAGDRDQEDDSDAWIIGLVLTL